jgi:hypothetical protein
MSSARACNATERGRSLLVGTVDSQGAPALCRAVAITSSDSLATATVYVPIATSRDVIANVASTRRIAIVAAYPPDHVSVQLKGTATGVRLAVDSEESMVREQFGAFVAVLHDLGIPNRIVGSMNQWPAFAIDLKVEEVFEQTPGPKAGNPLQ